MSSMTGVTLPLGIAILLTPVTAGAEPPAGPPDASAAPSPAPRAGPRFRFGVGNDSGWLGTASDTQPTSAIGALGLYLRLGLQASDLVGLHITGAVSSVLLTSYARGAFIVDFSPMDLLSIGTGFTVAATNRINVGYHSDNSIFIGVPVALSVYTSARCRGGARTGFGFTLTGNVGHADFGVYKYQGLGGGVTLSFGYEIR